MNSQRRPRLHKVRRLFTTDLHRKSNVFAVSRKPKGMDAKEPTEASAAHKQARLEEADTFRGVHLDPNAHHWDEVCVNFS